MLGRLPTGRKDAGAGEDDEKKKARGTIVARPLWPNGRRRVGSGGHNGRSEEHTSELQSHLNLVCRLLLEKKKNRTKIQSHVNIVFPHLFEKTSKSIHIRHEYPFTTPWSSTGEGACIVVQPALPAVHLLVC